MSKTYSWDVKETHGATWHHSPYTRDPRKRLRARERREMERIIEAWESYYPTEATLREFETATNKEG